MKKIIFFIFALLSATFLFAGSLSLSDKQGNAMPDGIVIDLWGDVNTSILKFEFDARNVGSVTHVSKMKKLEVFEVGGTFNLFCWDVCYLNDSLIVSTGTVSLTPNQSWIYGATEYYPQGQLGTTTVKYTIFKVSNPNDSNYFEVRYHITAVGMEDWLLNGIQLLSSPNPSTGTFHISVNEALNNSEFRVDAFTIDGKKVWSSNLFSLENKIELALPERGVYFIRIYRNGVLSGIARQVIIN